MPPAPPPTLVLEPPDTATPTAPTAAPTPGVRRHNPIPPALTPRALAAGSAFAPAVLPVERPTTPGTPAANPNRFTPHAPTGRFTGMTDREPLRDRPATPRHTTVSIGVLAQRYGICPESLRNWERLGLIPPARRTPGGHRRFAAEHFYAIERIVGGPVAADPLPADADPEAFVG
ncbi:MAG: MerR family DNA-binding transcriptional regulator [Planctomycetota bacterium]